MVSLSEEDWQAIDRETREQYLAGCGEVDELLARGRDMTLKEFRFHMMGIAIEDYEDHLFRGLCAGITIKPDESSEQP